MDNELKVEDVNKKSNEFSQRFQRYKNIEEQKELNGVNIFFNKY